MTDPTPIERALCCGLLCGRHKPEHGECQASTYGRRKREALEAAGYVVAQASTVAEVCDEAAAYIAREYHGTGGYPNLAARHHRDMAPIIELRAILPSAPPITTEGQGNG